MTSDRATILTQLTSFMGTLLDDDQLRDLTPQTPLADYGVLNSLGMARLVAFIHDELGVMIPARELTGRRFHNLDKIADLVVTAQPG